MWLGKILDLKDDIPQKIKDRFLKTFEIKKLTPLEFTILESIFNTKQISGYDLIHNLNKHFAGTWKARSGTIYPLLSKLKRKGFLDSKSRKSPIGPMVTIYHLTEMGEEILKNKVNKNFVDQLKLIENLLIELSKIYVQSFPDAEREDQKLQVQDLLRKTLQSIINGISVSRIIETKCPNCNADIDRADSSFCSFCGVRLDE